MGMRSSFINGVAVSPTVALGACVVSAAGGPVPANVTTLHAVA